MVAGAIFVSLPHTILFCSPGYKKDCMIHLAPFTQEDFNTLISWIDSEELLVQFAGPAFTYPLTAKQLTAYLEDKNRHAFKVIDAHNQAIGHAEVYKNEDNTAKICRVLIGHKASRGKGLGQELITQLVSFSIKNLRASSVELNVYDWNTPAIRCYEKVGFVIVPEKYTTITVKGNTWISLNMVFKG